MPNQNDKNYPFFNKDKAIGFIVKNQGYGSNYESSDYESIEDSEIECPFYLKTEILYSEITKETDYINMTFEKDDSEYIVSDFSSHNQSLYANSTYLSENNPKNPLQKIDQRIQAVSNLKQTLEKQINQLKQTIAQLKQKLDYLQRSQEIARLKQCLHPIDGKKDEKEVDSLRKLLHLLEENYYQGPSDKIGASQALEIAQVKALLQEKTRPTQEIDKVSECFRPRFLR